MIYGVYICCILRFQEIGTRMDIVTWRSTDGWMDIPQLHVDEARI